MERSYRGTTWGEMVFGEKALLLRNQEDNNKTVLDINYDLIKNAGPNKNDVFVEL